MSDSDRLATGDRQLLGYVAENVDDYVTVCTDCIDLFADTESPIRDGDHYGDQVPYPECYECGEVMRP